MTPRESFWVAVYQCGLFSPLLVSFLFCDSACAAVDPVPPPRPAITNGLMHYWPDPWNARDEVTGEEGAVLALLPETASTTAAPVEFGHRTGWVQLSISRPSVAFTVSCWLRWLPADPGRPVVLWLEREGHRWALRPLEVQGTHAFGVFTDDLDAAERAEVFSMTPEAWHHLALAQGEAGRLRVWVDGQMVVNGTAQREPPPSSDWLSVGNTPKGDQQWAGALTDLGWYGRTLTEREVQALYQAGKSTARTPLSNARRRAARHEVVPRWSLAVTRVSAALIDYHRYTSEDNLPGNKIQALVQTKDGFLWVGTEYGLGRFDGSRFVTSGLDDTPAMATVGCDISCLAEDMNGSLWAGLFGGLLRIHGSEVTAVTNGLPERFVLRLEPAGSNALWVAGYRTDPYHRGPCRLRRYLPATGESTAVTTVPGQVRQLVNTPEGVWIATEQPEMILFWDGRSRAPQLRSKVIGDDLFLGIAGADSADAPRLRGWRDPQRTNGWWAEMQFGSHGPIFHWLKRPGAAEAQVNRWSGERVQSAWIASGPGLAQVNDNALSIVEFPGRSEPPEAEVVCANREGGVWLGTWEDGLHLVRERPLKVISTAHGLAGNDLRSVCRAARGGAWIATGGGVHHWLDGRARLVAQGQIRSIAEDSAGRLWWGIQDSSINALRFLAPEGPVAFELAGMEWRSPNAIHFARDGTMWVICEAGVTWVKPERLPGGHTLAHDAKAASGFGRFHRGIELPDSDLFGLVEDAEGWIWIGSRDGGLYRMREGRVEIMDRAKGFPGNLALPALADKSGALWILSDTGIIVRRNNQFDVIGPTNGIPRDLLFGLVEDDRGFFWFPGGRGIHRILRADLEACLDGSLSRVPCLNLGLRDGMLTPECSAVAMPNATKLADGTIAVATGKGLVVIDPIRLDPNTSPLPVIFEKVVSNRRVVPIPAFSSNLRTPAHSIDDRRHRLGSVELPAGSGRQLELHYTAVSLVAADRVRFRYRLEGQDQDWSEYTAQRIAFYSNLRPGRYQFRVQCSNGHGIWPDAEWALGLVIHPYFWETRFFQAAAGFTVILVALLLHAQRVRTLRDLQELRHKQQFDGERARIAADMHDDLGAALTQIAILGEVAKRQVTGAPQAVSVLDRISQSARDITSRMSDLVWATNPRHDSLDNLSAHLREQAARMLQDTSVRPLLCFPATLPVAHLSATVRRNALLVMKEAVNNALRHAQPTEIRVAFEADPDGFRLLVEDNGCGFDPAQQTSAGNGLTNMRNRITALGGQYELISDPGTGTRIRLSVPFGKGI